MESGRSTITEQVNSLFEHRWPGGYKSANTLVAEYVSRATDRRVDRQYIYRIRTGRVRKVDVEVLGGIAAYFGKSLDHFAGPDRAEVDELTRELERGAFVVTGLKVRSLSPSARRELARLVREANEVLGRESGTVVTAAPRSQWQRPPSV